MERITTDVEAFHLGIADLDAFLVDRRVEDGLDFETGLGFGRRNQVDDVAWSVSGRPRQFCVMRQNRRCSILFHFTCPADSVGP
jgi:hypothetical protein